MQEQNKNKPTTMVGLAVTALGIVFGDIGTSPLYALRECFHGPHAIPVNETNIMGVLSLIFWSLIMVVTVKYVVFITKADDNGEGGTFALLSILRKAIEDRPNKIFFKILPFIALISASLLYSDGVITPAVSVLSSVEGLKIVTSAADPFIVPITCVMLVFLFCMQKYGTASIGGIFGPVMLLWFLTLAVVGVLNILENPGILKAANPYYAFLYFKEYHLHGIIILGTIVLCITGGEALYADLGHFSRSPIRNSWIFLVCPALLLNYFGQGSLLLSNPEAVNNPFYLAVPDGFLIPVLVLATLATLIASQALITGVFSLTSQAIQLGFLPRMRVVHTSSRTKGQVYLPTINTLLMLACVSLVIIFEESSGLAAAYGLAVTGAMGMTSVLYFSVTYYVWKWPLWRALPLLILFLCFDIPFLAANLIKISDGGWLPLMASVVIIVVMTTWKKGRAILAESFKRICMPLPAFIESLRKGKFARSPGTGVFMSMSQRLTPASLTSFASLVHAVPEKVVLLTITTTNTPYIRSENRIVIDDQDKDIGFYRVLLVYGYMENPNIALLLDRFESTQVPLDDATFYMGRETLLAARKKRKAMRTWRRGVFDFLSKNAWNASIFFNIPSSQVLEIGTRLKL